MPEYETLSSDDRRPTLGGLAASFDMDAGHYRDVPVAGIASDSRQVEPGFVFFAMPGTKIDGARFIPAAVAAGAIAIVGAGPRPADLDRVVLYLRTRDMRLALSKSAAYLFPLQPKTIVAVTGTAGKTSVAEFTRQILVACGRKAASLGTLGLIGPDGAGYGSLTTPDPITLHRTLDHLAREGVTHLAMEASSHGLDQARLDGVRLSAAAFTNLGRDHLDYHATIEDYFSAKLKLFERLLPEGLPAIINLDGDRGAEAAVAAAIAGRQAWTVGRRGEDLAVSNVEADGFGQNVTFRYRTRKYPVHVPLIGTFQIENVAVAAALALSVGERPKDVFKALGALNGVPGRLERVGVFNAAPVFVDYAHKPEALSYALSALRPFVSGKLIVVFGCGGDRDAGKRPIMGRIAADKADVVIVTDDNPRTEDPASIRAQVMAACPGGIEIGDRAEAIREGIQRLEPGDALVIAGKGHEPGQIIGTAVHPFSDHEVAREAIAAFGGGQNQEPKRMRSIEARAKMPAPLWHAAALPTLLGGRAGGTLASDVMSISIDTRTLEPGALFFAIKGDVHDGHRFVASAIEKGAALAVVDEAHARDFDPSAPLVIVDDVLRSMERLGVASRARMSGPVVAVTGSVGKTSTKEMLRIALSRAGSVHASVASYNNHWGVPLTLARMPADAEFGVFEIGMSNPFEILPLTAMVRPHVAIVTTVEPVHLAQFHAIEGIADAKGEVFAGLEQGGVAIINADNPLAARLAAHAAASRAGRIVRFGTSENADIRLRDIHLDADFSLVSAEVFGVPVNYRVGAPGRHFIMNSLAVLGAAHAVGADLALTALSLQDFGSVEGRGKRLALHVGKKTFSLIDESYNANPTSMRAALAVAGGTPVGSRGRRIAVMGDMLELGPEAGALHAGLAGPVVENDIDLVFACGPLMRELYSALPANRRGAYAEASEKLAPLVAAAVQPGDVVMVKGSLGSKMAKVVTELKSRFAVKGAAPADE